MVPYHASVLCITQPLVFVSPHSSCVSERVSLSAERAEQHRSWSYACNPFNKAGWRVLDLPILPDSIYPRCCFPAPNLIFRPNWTLTGADSATETRWEIPLDSHFRIDMLQSRQNTTSFSAHSSCPISHDSRVHVQYLGMKACSAPLRTARHSRDDAETYSARRSEYDLSTQALSCMTRITDKHAGHFLNVQ